MKVLEYELKKKRGGTMCLCSTSPHRSTCAEQGTGPSSWLNSAVLIEHMEPATTTMEVTEDFSWQPDGVLREDWLDKEVTIPKPVLSKQRMHKGFMPLELQKGLVDLLEEIDRDYLACVPGNSQLDDALAKECIVAGKAYEAEQARIVGIPVTPTPGIALPLPGVAFALAIPTIHLGIVHESGRGDLPLSMTGVLLRPVGRSAIRRVEWYKSCSITEPEFLALVDEAKKLPPGSQRRGHHSVLR